MRQMESALHLGTCGISGHAMQWTLRAEMWMDPDGAAAKPRHVADLSIHIDGLASPATGLAPFFPFALLAAMRAGVPLVVHGTMPVEWQSGCRRFQEIAGAWFPSLHRVEVHATWAASPPTDHLVGNGLVFSADLDSFHALHGAAATHLIYLRGSASGGSREVLVRSAAAAMGLPLITVLPALDFAGDPLVKPEDFPAASLASACRVMAGSLREVIWGSPHQWLTPPGGGDHFSLLGSFDANDVRIRIAGRGASRLAKWQTVAAMPLAREFLHVCGSAPDGVRHCGHCPSCSSARLALRALGVEREWPALAGRADVMDSAHLEACIHHDHAFCRQACDWLRQHAPDSEFTHRLEALLGQADRDAWARRLAGMGQDITGTVVWKKFARRLLPQVLATAAAIDPAWIRSLAGQSACPSSKCDD